MKPFFCSPEAGTIHFISIEGTTLTAKNRDIIRAMVMTMGNSFTKSPRYPVIIRVMG